MTGLIIAGVIFLIAVILFVAAIKIIDIFIKRPKNYTPIEERKNLSKLWQGVVPRIAAAKELIKTLDTEEIEIVSFDSLKLHGLLIKSKTNSKSYVLAIHGYKSTGLDDFSAYVPFYMSLGFNILMIDCRAHGKSEGKYISFGYHDRHDCVAWYNYLKDRFGKDIHIALHGISMGAATAIMTAGERPKGLMGVIADCGYSSMWHEVLHVANRVVKFRPYITLSISSLINRICAGFFFGQCKPKESIKNAECPFLLVHGMKDGFVPFYMLDELYSACACDKEKIEIRSAPHGASFWVENERLSKAYIDFYNRIGMIDHKTT